MVMVSILNKELIGSPHKSLIKEIYLTL